MQASGHGLENDAKAGLFCGWRPVSTRGNPGSRLRYEIGDHDGPPLVHPHLLHDLVEEVSWRAPIWAGPRCANEAVDRNAARPGHDVPALRVPDVRRQLRFGPPRRHRSVRDPARS